MRSINLLATAPALLRHMRAAGKALLVLVLLSLPAGCGSKVHYLDTTDVEIVSVKERTEDGVVVLNISFQNENSSDVNHSVYRVEWYDEDGNTIESTSWRPLTMRGGATVQVTERSTVPDVDDYKILISNDAR